LSKKEKSRAVEIPLRSSPRSRRKTRRPVRARRGAETKTAEEMERLEFTRKQP